MSILGLISAAVTLLVAVIDYLAKSKSIDAGQAEEINKYLRASQNEMQKTLAARDAVRQRIDRDPDSLRKPDGDERKWNPDELG